MAVQEPTVTYPEEYFQSAIVAVVKDILQSSGHQFILVESFGLDIAVFIAGKSGTLARFIEVKAFGAQRMGGVGFGNGRGLGSQVDLLLSQADCLPILNEVVRWVYADATQPVASRRYCLFICETAKAAAMGGVARGKQNNLKISAFRERLVDWSGLCTQMEQFLLTEQSMAAAG
jgi:hypothetical protein